MTGPKNWRWQGGLPYIAKYTRKGGKYQKYSIYIMEKHIGRSLTSNEIVHHINENPLDNRIENLMIMSPSEHVKHHTNIILQARHAISFSSEHKR